MRTVWLKTRICWIERWSFEKNAVQGLQLEVSNGEWHDCRLQGHIARRYPLKGNILSNACRVPLCVLSVHLIFVLSPHLLSAFLPISLPLFARNFKEAHGRLYSRKYGELINLWKSQQLEAMKHKMNQVTCSCRFYLVSLKLTSTNYQIKNRPKEEKKGYHSIKIKKFFCESD